MRERGKGEKGSMDQGSNPTASPCLFACLPKGDSARRRLNICQSPAVPRTRRASHSLGAFHSPAAQGTEGHLSFTLPCEIRLCTEPPEPLVQGHTAIPGYPWTTSQGSPGSKPCPLKTIGFLHSCIPLMQHPPQPLRPCQCPDCCLERCFSQRPLGLMFKEASILCMLCCFLQ